MKVTNLLFTRRLPPFQGPQPLQDLNLAVVKKLWNEYRHQFPWTLFMAGSALTGFCASFVDDLSAKNEKNLPAPLSNTAQKVDRVGSALIALLVDASGSMNSVRKETVDAVKEFISTQKTYPDTTLTITQFSDLVRVMTDAQPIDAVDQNNFDSQYHPSGSTALNDAIGETIIRQSQKIEGMNGVEKPNDVIIAIVTDGEENSSKKFTSAQIKQMIKEKQALGWTFIFLSADESLDIDQVTKTYGIPPDLCAAFAAASIVTALGVIANLTTAKRNGQEATITPEQRQLMGSPSSRGRNHPKPSLKGSSPSTKPSSPQLQFPKPPTPNLQISSSRFPPPSSKGFSSTRKGGRK